MLTVIVIDDEPLAIVTISQIIVQYIHNVQLLGTASNITTGMQLIQQYQPDLVLLDVDMPGGTGFDLLNTLPNRTFKVIFTTASSAHALQAIKAHAEDYILKPIDIQELKQAINLCELHIKQLTPAYKKLLLPTASGHELVDVHDIMYITANDNYCTVHTASNNKKTLVSKTLKQYEALLCNSGFYRIHQSHIVNLNYVDKYLKGRGGYVKLKTGIVLDVSIRKKSDFLKELSKY